MSGTDKALDLLAYLASQSRGVTFGQLKEQGYTAPTLSRLLKSLSRQGMVKKGEEGNYCLGEGARILARAILGESSREEKVRPLLKTLAGITGESAAFYDKTPHGIRLIAKEEMAESFHYIPEGSENHQEKHAFRLVLDKAFPPGQVIHEDWETAAGFDRLAIALYAPFYGSLGITFARGRYGKKRIMEIRTVLEEIVKSSALDLS